MTSKTKILLSVAFSAGLGALLAGSPAHADDPLMGKSPWNFDPVNRAQLAVVMKQIEDGGGAGGGSGTTIVCGGTSGQGGTGGTGSGSSATGNSNCIILNDADGNIIDVGQVSDGNQTSGSSAEVQNNGTNNKGSIDDVAAILNGGGP